MPMKAPDRPDCCSLDGCATARRTGSHPRSPEHKRYPIPALRRLGRAFTPHKSLLYLLAARATTGCTMQGEGFLSPEGPIAAAERQLFFEVTALTLIVVVPVLVLTPWLAWRYRRGNEKAVYRPKWEFSWPLEILAWGVPVVIVSILGLMLWEKTHQLDPCRPLPSGQPPLQIQVVGLDWKWLFIYPEPGIATVNELAIPVGRPVHLTLTSDTVMQSFMVPRLAGQIYAMAGMETQLYLQADHAGVFLGENTQYNGDGFQKQKFRTLALSDADFSNWVETARQSDEQLGCDQYTRLAEKGLFPQPVLYAGTPPRLFNWIVQKYQTEPTPGCPQFTQEDKHD